MYATYACYICMLHIHTTYMLHIHATLSRYVMHADTMHSLNRYHYPYPMHAGVMSGFNGAKKCCACKAFCSKSAEICKGCNRPCHKKCRQQFCCRPCNLCWKGQKRKRSCVCGKSMRSLGVSVVAGDEDQLHTRINIVFALKSWRMMKDLT